MSVCSSALGGLAGAEPCPNTAAGIAQQSKMMKAANPYFITVTSFLESPTASTGSVFETLSTVVQSGARDSYQGMPSGMPHQFKKTPASAAASAGATPAAKAAHRAHFLRHR